VARVPPCARSLSAARPVVEGHILLCIDGELHTER
jgi:hypothetical protein